PVHEGRLSLERTKVSRSAEPEGTEHVTIEFALIVVRLMNDEFEPCPAGKTDWLLAFEDCLMILIAMIRRERRTPAAALGFAVNRVGNAVPGGFHVSDCPAEFNAIRDRWILERGSLHFKFLNQETALADQPRSVENQIVVRQCLQPETVDIGQRCLDKDMHRP